MNTTEHTLQQLRDILARKEIVIFLGPDLPENLTGVPSWSELAKRLAERCRFPSADWSIVAARYEQRTGRRDLIEWLDEQLSGKTIGPIYPLLAALPVSKYIAATYDELLQISLKAAGRSPNIVVGEADLGFVKAGRPTVVKLLGEVSPGRLDTLLLTAADIQGLYRHRAKLLEQEVYPAMTGLTLLILGQNIKSEMFRTLYYQGQNNPLKRQAFAVWPGLDEWEKKTWNDVGLTIIDLDPLDFLQSLMNNSSSSYSIYTSNPFPNPSEGQQQPTFPLLLRPKKIKVLFLAANPAATNPLQIDEEIRQITTKIWAAEHRDALEIIPRFAVRADDILQALLEIKPHIVHFSGHGSSAGELIVVDDSGKAKPISTAALVQLFKTLKDNIRIVLLNACYTHTQAEAIASTIDCAIGMNKAIGDSAAIVFAASFYRAVGFGRSAQEAFDIGKIALLLEGIPEENTPELLVRTGMNASSITLIQDASAEAQ